MQMSQRDLKYTTKTDEIVSLRQLRVLYCQDRSIIKKNIILKLKEVEKLKPKYSKTDALNLSEKYEEMVVELSKWEEGEKISESIVKELGNIETKEQRDLALNMASMFISELNKIKGENSDKLYLSEIFEEEKVEFSINNLILSPVGSGKSYFMESLMSKNEKVLLLVSTSSLKRKFLVCEDDKEFFYKKNGAEVTVMTYSEFGLRIKFSTKYAKEFDLILCDEIHSLPLYQSYNDSASLLVAIHYLFSIHSGQRKYYFTATTEYIDLLKTKAEGILDEVTTFDYLKHPKIRKYIPLSSYKINGVEQVRPHLRARKESFEYFGHKIFAFCKTIESQIRLKEICEEEGFKAQAYWSVNNEEKLMTEDQIAEADKMIETGMLPDNYDVIIINSAMQEGWDLKDERVKLAIMNTINETEFVQALGRIRRNIDVLVYRVNGDEEPDIYVKFPTELLGKHLDNETRENLATSLGVRDGKGRILSWRSISKVLVKQGYSVISKQISINGERKRVSVVDINC